MIPIQSAEHPYRNAAPQWSVFVIARKTGRRCVRPVATLWGVTAATFALMNCLPGNAAQAQLGLTGSRAEEHALAARLGLNQPLPERYIHWLGQLLRGRLGTSLASGQPVSATVVQRLPVTTELVTLALVAAVGFAVPIAMVSAARPGGLLDRAVMAVGVTAISIAPFVLGIGLVMVFAVKLGWLPAIGFVPINQSLLGNMRSLTLPVCTLALPLFGTYTRVLRSDLVQQMQHEDYILTARATGASSWRVISRHALRNALFGSVTVIALSVGTLFGGAVIVEQIFALPGIGTALLQAVASRDTNVVEAIVLLGGICVLCANNLADRTYQALDQRVDRVH